jgi:hypothetical protein
MKGKSGIPAWFWGLAIVVGILVSQDFIPLLGMTISKGTITLIVFVGIAIALLDLYTISKKREDVEKFFTKVGLIDVPKIKKENRFHGYDIYLKLPMGKCLTDFKKQKEPLEQFLDNQVEMTYINKSIKVSVSDKKPSYHCEQHLGS